MKNQKGSTARELHEALQKATTEIGTESINPIKKEIRKFCSIIGDNNPIYFEENIFPPGYIMNLTNRVIQKIFFKIAPFFRSKIKGLIHVGSEVEFIKSMPLDQNYKIRIKTSKPVKKKGKMGAYYAILFETEIFDETNEKCAIDHHNFFFKL